MNVSDRVTVSERQLHGNQSNLINGSVVSMSGEAVKIHIDGEDIARDFPLDSVKSQEEIYGAELNSHHDNQVVDAIRR
jgi:hypothetical protein